MGIIRVSKRENPFVQVDKTGVNDDRLSFKATGILTYLLSKPDDWETYISQLTGAKTDGKDSVKTGIEELMKYGYVEREEKRDGGKFAGYDYTVYENPTGADYPRRLNRDGKTDYGKTDYGKSATNNNNRTNNDLTNNYKTNNIRSFIGEDLIEKLYNDYPRKVGKAKAKKAIASAIEKLASNIRENSREPIDKEPAVRKAFEFLTEKTRQFAKSPKGSAGKFTPYPATFFNEERYLDDPAEWKLESYEEEEKLYTWEEKLNLIHKGVSDSKFEDSGERDDQDRIIWRLNKSESIS